MVRLRAFRWKDLDGVLAVHDASVALQPAQGFAAPQSLEGYWRGGRERAGRDLWVVEGRAGIVAYGGLRPWHSPKWLQAEVVVHPQWRRQGLGQAVLGRLVEAAKRRAARYLTAIADDARPEGGEFLQKHGFEPFVPRQHMRLRPVVVPGAAGAPGHRVREAGLDDCAVLAELSNAAYGVNERAGRADAAGYRRYLEESGARVWLAEEEAGGRVVGLCEVREAGVILDGAAVRAGHIASLAVDPACRSRGLGRWLLSRGVRFCLEAGWSSVELNVDRDNAPALHLYESAGFRPAYAYTVYRQPLA